MEESRNTNALACYSCNLLDAVAGWIICMYRHFPSSITFVGKDKSLPLNLSMEASLLSNNRLGWKSLEIQRLLLITVVTY